MKVEDSSFQRHFSQESATAAETLSASASASGLQAHVQRTGNSASHGIHTTMTQPVTSGTSTSAAVTQKRIEQLEKRFHEPPSHLRAGIGIMNNANTNDGQQKNNCSNNNNGNDLSPSSLRDIHDHDHDLINNAPLPSASYHSFSFDAFNSTSRRNNGNNDNDNDHDNDDSETLTQQPQHGKTQIQQSLSIGQGQPQPPQPQPQPQSQPQSSIKITSPSVQILESVADQHMQKVSRSLAALPQDMAFSNPYSNASIGTFATSDSITQSSATIGDTNTNTKAQFSPNASMLSTNSHSHRSHSMNSNQTLITAHTTKRQVVVAESPPIFSNNDSSFIRSNINAIKKHGSNLKPGSFAINGSTPRVVRAILGNKGTPTMAVNKKTTTGSGTGIGTGTGTGSGTPTSAKRKGTIPIKKSVEKRRKVKVKGAPPAGSSQVVMEGGGRAGGPKTPILSSKASTSTGTTGPGTGTGTKTPPSPMNIGTAAASKESAKIYDDGKEKTAPMAVPSENRVEKASPSPGMQPITHFFGNSNARRQLKTSSKRRNQNGSSATSASTTAMGSIVSKAQSPLSNIATKGQPRKIRNDPAMVQQVEHLQQHIKQLTESLNEKTSQLKAVSNNQTIIHSQLKKALQQREKEMEALKEEMKSQNDKVRDKLEELMRKDSLRSQEDLKKKIASNGAKLGRWVYNWVGMRRETLWEDGSAIKVCEVKRRELKGKKDYLERRLKEGAGNGMKKDEMDREEFEQSIRIHLGELARGEIELKRQEDALHLEKNAHKLALKQVTNEDYSKFKSRPKVSFNGNIRYLYF